MDCRNKRNNKKLGEIMVCNKNDLQMLKNNDRDLTMMENSKRDPNSMYYDNGEFCIEQLTHFWNLPFFKSGMAEFERRMIELGGWTRQQVNDMKEKALKLSYWSKNYWVEMMMRNPFLFEEKTNNAKSN